MDVRDFGDDRFAGDETDLAQPSLLEERQASRGHCCIIACQQPDEDVCVNERAHQSFDFSYTSCTRSSQAKSMASSTVISNPKEASDGKLPTNSSSRGNLLSVAYPFSAANVILSRGCKSSLSRISLWNRHLPPCW
jgi:hypothetical protein